MKWDNAYIVDTKTSIKRLKKQDGFTLIEVLIALTIFAVGLLAIAAMQTSAIRMNSTGNRVTELSTLGIDRLENLIGEQPPEFWNQYKTDFAPGTNVRIHPLLDWTELNIWEYIDRENIPTVSLYYNHGDGKRYRSLGCYPCTFPVESDARNVKEIIEELKTGKFSNIAERDGRAQDKDDGGSLESLRREGYM